MIRATRLPVAVEGRAYAWAGVRPSDPTIGSDPLAPGAKRPAIGATARPDPEAAWAPSSRLSAPMVMMAAPPGDSDSASVRAVVESATVVAWNGASPVGSLGSASRLKVVTNYLCTVHLAALAEALTVCAVAGLDMNTAYEAIRISSGNSFVHETESQVILNGSRDINFTMDLVIKDVGLFDQLARDLNVPLEISPLVLGIFQDGQRRYGPREFSPNIIRRLEDACQVQVMGQGFPAQITDDEPEQDIMPGWRDPDDGNQCAENRKAHDR